MQRRRYVLQTMYDQGKITSRQLDVSAHAPLPKPDDVQLPGTQGPAQYFVNYVKDQLRRKVRGGSRLRRRPQGDDDDRPRPAGDLAHKAIDEHPHASGWARPRRSWRSTRATGAVRAMVGGTNFRKSQFNLATQAERQPGSSFKPIVLATALRQGISPMTTFDSKPVDIDAGDRVWHVTNYEGAYLGRVDLAPRHGFLRQLRLRPADEARRSEGDRARPPTRSASAASSIPISRSGSAPSRSIPLDMTRAYATFANGGKRVDGSLIGNKPRVIDQVEFARSGRTSSNIPVERPVMTTDQAALLTSILENVITEGTGKRAALADRPAAGKTGTTDNYGDAWFVGYTPNSSSPCGSATRTSSGRC